MYIDPFVCGVIATILVEMAGILVVAVILGNKGTKKEEE